MTFQEFLELGSFVVPRPQDDPRDSYFYADYLADPVANPLPSESGKFELYSQQKADHLNMSGLNPDPIKPYANYIVPVNGYEASFANWENKVKGDYPLQMYTPHYLRRGHTCYDNLAWTQEAFRNPVFMNASDAEERGIEAGDTVVISSPYGRCLRHAQPLQSMMPGTVAVPHGVHSVLDETDPDNIIDRGGSEQILYGPVSSNYYTVVNNYNTNLVEVALYDGDPIPEDYGRGPFLIEA